MNDEELQTVWNDAADAEMTRQANEVGFGSNTSAVSRKLALRAVFNAGLERAKEIADEVGHNWSGAGATAAFQVYERIEAEKGRS